ncbi:MAG: hypothetical protein IJM25_05140 [Eubacterium sp.]|nr:hypothetical protein [Eubacterium sp.]
MFWAFLIFLFSVLLQAGAGYAVGDIIAHALSYDLTRKTAIWEGVLIIVLLLLKSWMEYHFAPEKKSRAAISVPESVIWFAGTIVLAVILELYTDLGIPVKIAVMLLFVVCSLVFERESYLQYFRVAEDGDEEERSEDDEYSFAADRKRKDDEEPENDVVKETAANPAATEAKNTRILAEDDEIRLEIVENAAPMETEAGGNETSGEEGRTDRVDDTGEGHSGDSETTQDGNEAKTKETSVVAGFHVCARVIAYVASILIGILALITLHDTENRLRAYIIMLTGSIVTVIFRLVPGEPGVRNEESEDTAEEDSMTEELIREEKLRRKRIIYIVVSLLVTVFLCTRSVLVGLIFLLDAFLIGVIIPMATYRYAIGGTDVVEKKTDILSRITSRVLLTVILIIAAWLLSYGALWEYEFLMILGTAFAAQELLLGQNARVFICKE